MPHSHVDAFINSFEKLLPDERKAAMAELRAFFDGYEASCQEWEREMFGAAEGEPRVLGEVSGQTLGVTWDRATGKWMAHVKISGKTVHLGRYTTELVAAQAREQYIAAHPELHARANFPEQPS